MTTTTTTTTETLDRYLDLILDKADSDADSDAGYVETWNVLTESADGLEVEVVYATDRVHRYLCEGDDLLDTPRRSGEE